MTVPDSVLGPRGSHLAGPLFVGYGDTPWPDTSPVTAYDVRAYGAVGDGVTNDAAAIQACLTAAVGSVFFPPGNYYLGTTTLVPPSGLTMFGSDYTQTLITYAGTGSAFKITNAINSSGYGRVTWKDLQIVGTGGTGNTGAGIELLAGGYAYYNVYHCRIVGQFKYGVLGDGIEVANFYDNIIENGTGITDSVNIWIVNGDDRRAGQLVGFSNVINIFNNQLNAADYGIVDDGGSSISIIGNNFNGHGLGLWMAGRTGFVVLDNAFENHGRVTHVANCKFADRSAIGGGSATTDKAPCHAGLIAGNAFAADVSAGSALAFTATTAAAYHSALEVKGNWFRNSLGLTSAIDVTRLGKSFCGFNTDDATARAHYGGKHFDTQANTLLLPGGTTDSYSALANFPVLPTVVFKTASWTPTAGLADGAVSSVDVTVTSAVTTDGAVASFDQIGANSVLLSAYVRAADTVRVVLMNKTGAPLTLSAGTVSVYVMKIV